MGVEFAATNFKCCGNNLFCLVTEKAETSVPVPTGNLPTVRQRIAALRVDVAANLETICRQPKKTLFFFSLLSSITFLKTENIKNLLYAIMSNIAYS